MTSPRRGTPVHRSSLEAGTFEHEFFAPVSFREGRRFSGALEAAIAEGVRLRRAAADGRRLTDRERLLASLRNNALAVFNKLLRLAAAKAGAVFPTYEQLAEWSNVSRATVARIIDLLCQLQFLFRQRRFIMTNDGDGSRYRQTSNAYRIFLPVWMERLLPRHLRQPPLPDDEIQRQQDRVIDQAEMLNRLSQSDFVRATVADDSLAAVLVRMAAAIDSAPACESQIDPEPGEESIG